MELQLAMDALFSDTLTAQALDPVTWLGGWGVA
jgi:hypothetical protein